MTRQLAGQGQGGEWQPALVEIEDALVPAFIVEKLDRKSTRLNSSHVKISYAVPASVSGM